MGQLAGAFARGIVELALLGALLGAHPAARDAAAVTWHGAKVSTGALPAGFPSDALPAVEQWAPWARAHGYKLDLELSGRVLLVVGQDSGAGRWLKLAESTLRTLDEHLPAPQRAAAPDGAGRKPKSAGGGIPEDPEAPPAGATPPPGHGAPTASAWGAGTRPLDTETVVLFLIRTEEDEGALLDALVESAPYLATWRATAASHPGFALEQPLAGAVVLGASGQEEWNPENEFVHRVAELSLLRRFGRQPYWLLQGWAWFVELAIKRSVYCFPYRSGFVGVGEHTGWDRQLKLEWGAEAAPVPGMRDLAALRRGVWDQRAARHAWGTVAFLDRYYRVGWIDALEDLRGAWDKGSRVTLGAGRWERDVDYEVPLEAQLKLLAARTSTDFLGEVRSFFAQGPAFKPGR